MITEEAYYHIKEHLEISIQNLYKHHDYLLKQIEEGIKVSTIDKPSVGYQGVPGSFGEEASLTYFNQDYKELVPHEEFEDIFQALCKGTIDYGVVPIENSSAGEVLEVYDLMTKYELYIIAEETIKVEHNLLGIKGANIEDIIEVYSHPQALAQSKEFLKQHRYMERKAYVNTAMASEFVARQGDITKAAIGSKRAADLYGLEILQERIQFNQNNYTRFIVLSRQMNITKQCNKISIVFTTSHTSGALYSILGHFAYNGLNLLKIHSRPLQDKTWHYFFFADLEGNLQDANVLIALGKIKEQSKYFKILGNYKQA